MHNNLRVLVTGISGFVGTHLANELRSRGAAVIGMGSHAEPPEALKPLLSQYISCDLTDSTSVEDIDFTAIDAVIHLAALSSQGQSFSKPHLFISANSAMVINLFERALSQKLEKYPRFIMVSTGAVYDSSQPMPITEEGAITHGSPYAISKLLCEDLGDYYRTRGIQSVVVRPMNHTGPGQGPGFILPDFVKQAIELGADGTLKVGNIQAKRDYTDVRDIVRAYVDLALAPYVPHNLYNLCSGQSRSGEELLDMISDALYGSASRIATEVDPSRIRPNDPPDIYGSHQRIKQDLGWEPKIPLEQTVRDYVKWFKQQG